MQPTCPSCSTPLRRGQTNCPGCGRIIAQNRACDCDIVDTIVDLTDSDDGDDDADPVEAARKAARDVILTIGSFGM